jgi:chemotaxis protein CheD
MKKNEHILNIGGHYASTRPVIIRTLLGSCVAVCLYDTKKKIGGMNHILLPGKADLKNFNNQARFGVNAMRILFNSIIRHGGRKDNLVAKIFGGANILGTVQGSLAIGSKNVSFVKEFLELESIPIRKENTGGTDTRVIHFHTDTGSVYLRRVPSRFTDRLAAEEKEMMRKFREEVKKISGIK